METKTNNTNLDSVKRPKHPLGPRTLFLVALSLFLLAVLIPTVLQTIGISYKSYPNVSTVIALISQLLTTTSFITLIASVLRFIFAPKESTSEESQSISIDTTKSQQSTYSLSKYVDLKNQNKRAFAVLLTLASICFLSFLFAFHAEFYKAGDPYPFFMIGFFSLVLSSLFFMAFIVSAFKLTLVPKEIKAQFTTVYKEENQKDVPSPIIRIVATSLAIVCIIGFCYLFF